MKEMISLVAGLLLTGTSAATAAPVTITFDGGGLLLESYTASGFTFSPDFGTLSTAGNILSPRFAGQTVTVTSLGGSPFGLTAFDVGVARPPQPLTVTGTRIDGETVTASVDVTADSGFFSVSGSPTATVGDAFAALTSFSFQQGPSVDGFDDFRFDNFVLETDPAVSAAVPLPAAGWLLLGGIGLIAAQRRRL